MENGKNVLGGPLQVCGTHPMTGFFRDGCCKTGPHDQGRHVVCAQVTAEFLAFSRDQGNDLITPAPQYAFPGLKPGDRWCLCASRWRDAFQAGAAPRVFLHATHEKALTLIPLEELLQHAADLDSQEHPS